MSEQCVWNLDEDGEMHETSCGEAFVLSAGTLKENEMKFCCYCGKGIKEFINGEDLGDG